MTPSETQPESRAEQIHRILCNFVDGLTPSIVFRTQLQQCKVHVTQEIERLIRKHESDNSTRYRDYAKVIFRNEAAGDKRPVEHSIPEPMATPFAKGGAWSDGRGAPEPQGSELGSGYNSQPPPYATMDMSARNDPSRLAPTRGIGGRKDQCNGDIIAWRDEDLDGPGDAASSLCGSEDCAPYSDGKRDAPRHIQVQGAAPMAPGWRTNGDIISWSTKDVTPHARRSRFGKRYFGQNDLGSTPFGTDADVLSASGMDEMGY